MNETEPPRHRGRSIGALLGGFFTVVILAIGTDILLHVTGIFPTLGQPMSDALLGLATGYRNVYAVIGSYLTARLAPDRPMGHALVGGAIGFILATIGAVATWNKGPAFGPHWYPVGLIVTALPCAWVGGKMRVLEMRGRPAQQTGRDDS